LAVTFVYLRRSEVAEDMGWSSVADASVFSRELRDLGVEIRLRASAGGRVA
jgi:hypothetical protein